MIPDDDQARLDRVRAAKRAAAEEGRCPLLSTRELDALLGAVAPCREPTPRPSASVSAAREAHRRMAVEGRRVYRFPRFLKKPLP